MKKMLSLIILTLFLTGCGAEPISKTETKNSTYYIQDSMNFDFYIDKETCVEYIIFSGRYKGGITPRLNTDGTLKLNETCLEEKRIVLYR